MDLNDSNFSKQQQIVSLTAKIEGMEQSTRNIIAQNEQLNTHN